MRYLLGLVVVLAVCLVYLVGMTPHPIAAQGSTPVVFAVIGDYGWAGDPALAVSRLVKSWNPDFVITTGDNNYPNGEAATIDRNIGQYYSDFIYPYTGSYGSGSPGVNRFFPSLGNHDWVTPGAVPYLAYFTLPGNERYYTTTIGPVGLFSIDSDPDEPDGVGSASAQAQWLQVSLAASTACWNLVYFHHPPFSSAAHGSNLWMQWPFQAWGADAVLGGHDHTYERIIRDGFLYFVNGLGGAPRYGFLLPVTGSQVRYNNNHGAMRVTATQTSITYEFIAINGSLIDTFTQTGGCPPTPTPTPLPCCDLNRDGQVDVRDIQLVAAQWGNPYPAYDFNGDGVIDTTDVMRVVSRWHQPN